MGKPLTEEQKAERARKTILRKEKAELGPLFEDQAQAADAETLLLQRRLGWARLVEHGQVCGGGLIDVLEELHEHGLARLAAQHVPAEEHARLAAYRRRTYPPSATGYGISFWLDILTGKRVVFGWKRVDDPSTSVGFRVVEDGVWPPDGWQPPLTREQAATLFWRDCRACGLPHAPGQLECLPEVAGAPRPVLTKGKESP